VSQFLLGAPVATLPGIKIKGLFVGPTFANAPGQPTVPDPSIPWTSAWTDVWWYTLFSTKAQVDLAVSVGCNTVKSNGPLEAWFRGGADLTQIKANIDSFMTYTRGLSLHVYWQLGVTDDWQGTLAQTAAALGAEAAFISQYPHVVAIDCVNEINIPNNQGLAVTRCNAITPQVRASTNLPITYSLSTTGPTGWAADGWATVLAPYVDFQDFHPYYGGASTPTGGGHIPASDVDAYRALPSYRPFLIGESGAGVASGATVQTNRWTDIGTISGSSGCRGAVGFLAVDYETTTKFGVWDQTYANPRSQITTPFAAWPTS
jgi:hypothetical protein